MKPEFVQFLVIVLILLGPIAFNHKRNQCGQQAGGISARVARGVVVHKYKACAPRRIVCDGRITAKAFRFELLFGERRGRGCCERL